MRSLSRVGLDDLVLVADVEVGQRFVEEQQLGSPTAPGRSQHVAAAAGKLCDPFRWRRQGGNRRQRSVTRARSIRSGAEPPSRSGPAERDKIAAPDASPISAV